MKEEGEGQPKGLEVTPKIFSQSPAFGTQDWGVFIVTEAGFALH